MNWKTILRFKAIGVVLVLALMLISVGYVAAMERDSDWDHGHHGDDYIADPIWTDAGYVSGSKMDSMVCPGPTTLQTELFGPPALPGTIGIIGDVVRVYRGIPYAAPPLGNLRWKPPQPVTPWKGIRECTVFSPMAPQLYPSAALYGSIPESGMSEDCLYLNVLTPAKTRHDRLPVMVWFHGGGFFSGSSNPANNNSPPLPQHGVVLVTIQHRLGALGYMCLPALAAESGNVCGNYGFLDLIASLQWVQRNIAAFGGDPHNVTIFGESGGGGKVNTLMASPLAKGLFQRAICESGWMPGPNSVNLTTGEYLGGQLVNYLVTNGLSASSSLADLRNAKWEDIVNASESVTLGAPSPSGYADAPTVDGYFLTDFINNIFSTDRQNDVPYMVGMNGGDITTIFTGTTAIVPTIKQRSNVYVYLFNHVPTGWYNGGILDAYHGLDVAYEFGFYPWDAFFWGTLFFPFSSYCGIDVGPNPGLDGKDVYVGEAMMTMWSQFAATGNPSVKHLISWPAYNSTNDQYLYIDDPLAVKSGFSGLTEPGPSSVPPVPHCGL